MPKYVVEHNGKQYEVEAQNPEQAAAAFDPPDMGERIRQNAAAASRGFSGVARAPLAVAEGAGELMHDVRDAVIAGAGRLGVGDPRAAEIAAAEHEQFNQAVQRMRAEAEARAPGSVAVGDVAAGVMPLGAASKANTLRRAATLAATEGAVMANLPYDPDDSRIQRTAIGAVLPGLVRATAAAPGAFMNTIRRMALRRADPETAQLRQEAQAAFTDPTTGQALPGRNDYTIMQEKGDPRLTRLGMQSADTTARDVTRAQMEARLANVRAVIDNMSPKSVQTIPERAEELYRIVDRVDRDMGRAASQAYGDGLRALRASPEGQALRLPMRPVMDEIRALEADFGDLLGVISKSATGQRLAETISTLKKLEAGNVSAFKLDGLEKLQQGLNAGRTYGQAALDPAENAANKIRMRLQAAIERSVDEGPESAGLAKLRAVQSDYRRAMDERRRLGDDALTKLFGDKSVLADPEAAFDSFITKNPAAQKLGVNILNAVSPSHVQYFKKRALDRVLDEATRGPNPAMASKLDPEALYRGLTGKAIMESPLFTPKEKAWAMAAAKDLRVILNAHPDVTKVGTDLPPADLAINVVSMTPAFVARYLARASTGLGLENIMFTQQGRQALNTVANLRTASQAQRDRALAYFAGLVSREGEIEEQQQEPAQ